MEAPFDVDPFAPTPQPADTQAQTAGTAESVPPPPTPWATPWADRPTPWADRSIVGWARQAGGAAWGSVAALSSQLSSMAPERGGALRGALTLLLVGACAVCGGRLIMSLVSSLATAAAGLGVLVLAAYLTRA